MTEQQLNAILASRGYQRIPSPDPMWRSWLWVQPIREDAIPTKLCQWWTDLSEEGLRILLDQNCELKTRYYTDAQRERNQCRMSLQARPYEEEK